jgi:hypothetical protein
MEETYPTRSKFDIAQSLLVNANLYYVVFHADRLCGLVVRVLGYGSRGSGSIPGNRLSWGGGGGRKAVVGLERGPLSLMSRTEELLDRKVAAPV